MLVNISGSGAATATLHGRQLTIAGSIEGLKSPATIAELHRGIIIDLMPDQVDSLRKGQLCIQIHSEKASAGNLWGWLLP